jgi:quercetin dioxygenase-like cupin family protein
VTVRSKRLALLVVVLAVILGSITVVAVRSGSDDPATPAGSGVTRTQLGRTDPANAPGHTLYLEQVTIAPGVKLPEHFHQGTQVARVVSGVLTYNVISGTVTVTRADGRTEEASGPKEVRVGPGESVTETAGLVHFGANDGKRPVVIELAALLEQGAPLATTLGGGATGTSIHLTADLESQSRSLFTAGADDSVVYGWNRLAATAAVDGQPVGVDVLAGVNYAAGSGPFSGFITFSFADGSTLGVAMNGGTQASPDTANAAFVATLGVVGGTGRYEAATGNGTFVGSRTAALGTRVAATFDLKVNGIR